ncbi:hypothetical protein [Deefgea piscis]|uniref:hypothetical protein n=1 Tax=Deefgea piscis TaxID=2739061 RepID=UPI001C826EE2|nr:hypothetical protein [Deefgea piscis]QZA81558.1 hypothetical protein K4H25_02520 [Deefgea piscis]
MKTTICVTLSLLALIGCASKQPNYINPAYKAQINSLNIKLETQTKLPINITKSAKGYTPQITQNDKIYVAYMLKEHLEELRKEFPGNIDTELKLFESKLSSESKYNLEITPVNELVANCSPKCWVRVDYSLKLTDITNQQLIWSSTSYSLNTYETTKSNEKLRKDEIIKIYSAPIFAKRIVESMQKDGLFKK